MIRKFTYFIATCCIVIGVIGLLVYGVKDPTVKDVAYTKKWDFKAAEFKNFILNSDYDIDVEFRESPDQSGYVELSGKLPPEKIASLENVEIQRAGLNLDLERDSVFQFQVFDFSFSSDQKLVIALPQGEVLDLMELNSTSSNIDVERARAMSVKVKTTSGDLNVKQLDAEQVKLEATSGNIKGQELQGQVELTTKSGEVRLDQLSGDIVAVVTSGNIDVKDHVGTANLRTTSGNIELTQLQITPEVSLESTSGNVDLTIPQAFDGVYDVKTNSGEIEIPDTTLTTKDMVKARTSSGNITIDKK
ncbi:DUF4097 family beta strand repeat-containing protein [Paenibacillus sp. GCM10027629]|uniref:DUF4097 family beta strand repeat-containing protein n=1 Tax=Paenibacillus sp. GCM10027629 TaxID=3273414 RepID=UPI0036314253